MAEINPVPEYPDAANLTQCGPGNLLLLSTPGLNGTVSRWYDSLTGGSLLVQGNDYLTSYLTISKRFYVSSYNESTGCESSRKEVMAVILPVPGLNTIVGPSMVGVGQTNVIYSVNYQPGSTYDWSVPPGMNLLLENQNFVIVEFPNIGNYNLSVIETNSIGCVGPPATKPVEVKADIIVLDINILQGEACVGTDMPLSVTPSGGTPSYTFTWGGDVQYLSAVNISNPVFNAPTPGDYMVSVMVSDINGNHSADTIQVTVFSNPQTQIIAPDSLVCAGSDLPLDAMVNGGSGIYDSYLWSGQTAPLSATDIRNPSFNTYLRGVYKLVFTVEDNHGCRASDSINITSDSPRSSFISNAVPGCSPVQVDLYQSVGQCSKLHLGFWGRLYQHSGKSDPRIFQPVQLRRVFQRQAYGHQCLRLHTYFKRIHYGLSQS